MEAELFNLDCDVSEKVQLLQSRWDTLARGLPGEGFCAALGLFFILSELNPALSDAGHQFDH